MKTPVVACNCFFCKENLPHPVRHTKFMPTHGMLLKAESLDPKDWIALEACATCGHKRLEIR